VKARIMSPADYIGPIMALATERRGIYKNMTYLDTARSSSTSSFRSAKSSDFFDKLKTISRGYASLDYDMLDYRDSDLVKLEMLINGDLIAFS
jgi:GTP-binding protein LepA